MRVSARGSGARKACHARTSRGFVPPRETCACGILNTFGWSFQRRRASFRQTRASFVSKLGTCLSHKHVKRDPRVGSVGVQHPSMFHILFGNCSTWCKAPTRDFPEDQRFRLFCLSAQTPFCGNSFFAANNEVFLVHTRATYVHNNCSSCDEVFSCFYPL